MDALDAESIEAVLDDIRSGYSYSNSLTLLNVNSLLPLSTSVVDTLYPARLGHLNFQKLEISTREDSAVVLNQDAIVLMADVPCSNAVLQVVSAPVHRPATLVDILATNGYGNRKYVCFYTSYFCIQHHVCNKRNERDL